MDDYSFEVEESTPLPPEQQADDVPQVNLELEGPRLPSRRKRVAQTSLVLVAIVAVVVLFHSTISSSSLLPSGQAHIPQVTIPPPTTLIMSNITFGTITINNIPQHGTVPLFFVAKNSIYTITITAPPFQPVSCIVLFTGGGPQGPIKNSQDCSMGFGGPGNISVNGIPTPPAYWVAIDFTATDLPLDQQHQVTSLLTHSITSQHTTTVPIGSYVATSFTSDTTIASQLATTPLQATAFLVASTTFGPIRGPCTGLICPISLDPQESTTLTGMVWIVGVPVAVRWHFTTSTGRVLGEVSFRVANTIPTVLAYTPGTGWSLSSQSVPDLFNPGNEPGPVDCDTGAQLLQQQLQNTHDGSHSSNEQGIEGCHLTAQNTSSISQGSFVWRFGVLLAADDAAHHLLPNLPIAPSAEISAVPG